jgi:hypothetical protein
MEWFYIRKHTVAIMKEHMLFFDYSALELSKGLVVFNQNLVQSLAKFQGLSGRGRRQLCTQPHVEVARKLTSGKIALSRRRGFEKKVRDCVAKYVSGNAFEAFCAASINEVRTELYAISMEQRTIKKKVFCTFRNLIRA